jgi:hypothetical protein
MTLSKITVNVGEGGLGRRAPNKDKISGLLFYNDNKPTGFGTDAVKKVFTLEQAEALGIVSTDSDHEVEHYHISEYFRMNPEGELWIGYYDVPAGAYSFEEIATLAEAANGEIRQMGVYTPEHNFQPADCTTIQSVIDGIADAATRTLSILFAANISLLADLSTLTDLRTLDGRQVSVIISQDGGAAGAALFTSKAYTISTLGAHLGAVSKAPVQRSVGYPAEFKFSNGVELEVPAYGNGDLVSETPASQQGTLKSYGYTILRTYTEFSGSYSERMPCAVAATSDYAFLELNRVIAKAIRGIMSALQPELNKDVSVNTDGTLTYETIEDFRDKARKPLQDMQSEGNISVPDDNDSDGFEVLIDPAQDVVSSSTLVVTVKIVPKGTTEFITLNIGLSTEL